MVGILPQVLFYELMLRTGLERNTSRLQELRKREKAFAGFEILHKQLSFRIEAMLNGNRDGLRSSLFSDFA